MIESLTQLTQLLQNNTAPPHLCLNEAELEHIGNLKQYHDFAAQYIAFFNAVRSNQSVTSLQLGVSTRKLGYTFFLVNTLVRYLPRITAMRLGVRPDDEESSQDFPATLGILLRGSEHLHRVSVKLESDSSRSALQSLDLSVLQQRENVHEIILDEPELYHTLQPISSTLFLLLKSTESDQEDQKNTPMPVDDSVANERSKTGATEEARREKDRIKAPVSAEGQVMRRKSALGGSSETRALGEGMRRRKSALEGVSGTHAPAQVQVTSEERMRRKSSAEGGNAPAVEKMKRTKSAVPVEGEADSPGKSRRKSTLEGGVKPEKKKKKKPKGDDESDKKEKKVKKDKKEKKERREKKLEVNED